jgi:pentatricopeptide repeat protein
MRRHDVTMTPYIANCLIHGWATEGNIGKAKRIYDSLGRPMRREPSTYEAMARAFLAVGDRRGARNVLDEMRGRGYPVMVVQRVADLLNTVAIEAQL